MPVKPINYDAKAFFGNVVAHLLNEVNKPAPRNYTDAVMLKIANLVQQRKTIETLLANSALWEKSRKTPEIISDFDGNKFKKVKFRGRLYLFKNTLFDVMGLFSDEEAKVAVQKRYEKDRSEIDFLKSRSDECPEKSKTEREHISERIRNEVWRRDGGKCVECGSVYKLEFDHVIPVAKGGSNTARNLRILCEPCNRRKSDSIG